MATANPTVNHKADNVAVFTWNLTDANDVGAPIPEGYSAYSDRSVQVYGTFGGGTVTWQGTNDPTPDNWVGLSTVASAAATFAAAGIKQILESTLLARPSIAGGTSQDVTVVCVARRPVRI